MGLPRGAVNSWISGVAVSKHNTCSCSYFSQIVKTLRKSGCPVTPLCNTMPTFQAYSVYVTFFPCDTGCIIIWKGHIGVCPIHAFLMQLVPMFTFFCLSYSVTTRSLYAPALDLPNILLSMIFLWCPFCLLLYILSQLCTSESRALLHMFWTSGNILPTWLFRLRPVVLQRRQ